MHTTFFFKQQEAGLQIFVRGWELYRQVIAHNYMRHAEMITTLRAECAADRRAGLRVLELGCGDAHVVGQALAGWEGVRYTGVDLSARALAHARENLAGRDWELHLVTGEMFQSVQRLEGDFDLILAGYSLHHFPHARKGELLERLGQRLAPDGKLVAYDLHRREDESREAYLERLLADNRANWTAMTEAQMHDIHEHVRQNDYPESIGGMMGLATACGFEPGRVAYRDPAEFYGLLSFRKPIPGDRPLHAGNNFAPPS